MAKVRNISGERRTGIGWGRPAAADDGELVDVDDDVFHRIDLESSGHWEIVDAPKSKPPAPAEPEPHFGDVVDEPKTVKAKTPDPDPSVPVA